MATGNLTMTIRVDASQFADELSKLVQARAADQTRRLVAGLLLAGYLLACALAARVVLAPVAELPEVHRVEREQAPTFDPVGAWTEMDADVLALVAKAEDPRAGRAVMWTVLNRGGSVLRAVTRPHQYAFNPARRWTNPPDRAQLRALRRLARAVLDGRAPDPTAGATHFHLAGTWTPPWAPRQAAWSDHGSHHFYKERT
jgi:hypothetical protein